MREFHVIRIRIAKTTYKLFKSFKRKHRDIIEDWLTVHFTTQDQ